MRVSETAETVLAALFRAATPSGEAGQEAGAEFEAAFLDAALAQATPASDPVAASAHRVEGRPPRWVADLLSLVTPDASQPAMPEVAINAAPVQSETPQPDPGPIDAHRAETDPPDAATGLAALASTGLAVPPSAPAIPMPARISAVPVEGAGLARQHRPEAADTAPGIAGPRVTATADGLAPLAKLDPQTMRRTPLPVADRAVAPEKTAANMTFDAPSRSENAAVAEPSAQAARDTAPRGSEPGAVRQTSEEPRVAAPPPSAELGIPIAMAAALPAATAVPAPARGAAEITLPPVAAAEIPPARPAMQIQPPDTPRAPGSPAPRPTPRAEPQPTASAALDRAPDPTLPARAAQEANAPPASPPQTLGSIPVPARTPAVLPITPPMVQPDTFTAGPITAPEAAPSDTARPVLAARDPAQPVPVRTEFASIVAVQTPPPSGTSIPGAPRPLLEPDSLQTPQPPRQVDTAPPATDASKPIAIAPDAREPAEPDAAAPVSEAEVSLAPGAEPRGSDSPRPAEASHRPSADHGQRAAQQVAVALAMNPEGRIELALDPEELGPVRLGLVPGDGSVTVHLAAERAETLDLLRRHTDLLARELRQAGYGDVSFRFGSETPTGGRQPPRHGYDSPPSGATAPDAPVLERPVPVYTPRRSLAAGALDLRL